MTLSFKPEPAGAPRARQVWAHALMEAGTIVRNGEQLLLAVVLPLAALIGGRYAGPHFGLPYQPLAPSVLAMVMWSSGLTTLAIATGFERRYNVLERLAATPLGREGILLGKGLSIAMITAGQVLLLALAALLLGWRPALDPLAMLVALVTALLSMGAFIALGLAISGSLKPETTLAVANLLFLVALPLGILIPVDAFPDWATLPVSLLPTAALGETLRAAAEGDVLWQPILVSLVWFAGAAALARKVFKWMS